MIPEAVILAGGLGQRMGEVSGHIPKWLTPIGDTTLAHLQLEWLSRSGIGQVYVTMNRRYSPLPITLMDIPQSIQVEIIWEEEPIGDEGGLKGALEYIKGESAIVLNCDVLSDLSLSLIPPPETLVVVHPRSPWGVLKRRRASYKEHFPPISYLVFEEKPILQDLWVNAGIYHFSKLIRRDLQSPGMIPEHLIPLILSRGKEENVMRYAGKWLAVETPKDVEGAREFTRVENTI